MANSPSKDKQAVTMRLRKDLVSDVQRAAAERKETMTAFVVDALEDALSKHRAEASPDDGCIATSG